MKENQNNKFEMMTKRPLAPLIISLGIPTTISMLISNIYNLVDTYFVSQLGTSQSGAVGIVFALMAILQAIGFMLGQGAGSNISRRLGANNPKEATEFASTSFFIALGAGIFLCIAGLIFNTTLMKMLGSTDTILPYAKTYGTYILISAPAMLCCFVMNNILRFEGMAFFGMIGMASGAALNILGDILFVKVLHMGVGGAGLSTAISQYVSVIILLSVFLRGKTQSRLSIRKVTRNFVLLGTILATGFPSLIRQGLNSIAAALLNHAAKGYGDPAVAAFSIVSRTTMFLFCVGLGIGQGFQPVCGFNYGAGKYSRVKKAVKFTVCFELGMIACFAAFGFIGANHIVPMFSSDAKVIKIGVYALRIQCIALLFQPLSVCGNMLFQSVGKNIRATVLSSFRSGLFFIPLILILPRLFGLKGIQFAQPCADILAGVVAFPVWIRFIKKLPEDKEENER